MPPPPSGLGQAPAGAAAPPAAAAQPSYRGDPATLLQMDEDAYKRAGQLDLYKKERETEAEIAADPKYHVNTQRQLVTDTEAALGRPLTDTEKDYLLKIGPNLEKAKVAWGKDDKGFYSFKLDHIK